MMNIINHTGVAGGLLVCFSMLASVRDRMPFATQLFGKKYSELTEKSVNNALKIESFSGRLITNAAEQFLKNNFVLFDAAIGDNLCQVRAHAVAHIYNLQCDSFKTLLNRDYQKAVLTLLENTQLIFRNQDKTHVSSLKESLKKGLASFLNKNSVFPIVLKDDQKIIVLSYLLTKYYSDFSHERAQGLEQLAKESCMTLTSAQNLMINEARKMLNSLTCSYIDILAKKYDMQKYIQQQEKLNPFISPSTYLGFRVLLHDIIKQNIPICIKSNIQCKDHGVHQIVLSKQDTIHNKLKVGMVIEGISDPHNLQQGSVQQGNSATLSNNENCFYVQEVQKYLKNKSLAALVLSNSAMHTQFVKKDRCIDFSILGTQQNEEEQQFNMYKQQALADGLCRECTKMFCITHIYPDVVEHIQTT